MKIATINLTNVRKSGLILSLVMMIMSLAGLFSKGLNFGIDFTGGYITEFTSSVAVEQKQMKQALASHIEGKFELTSAQGLQHWIVRQPDTGTGATAQSWVDGLTTQLINTRLSRSQFSQSSSAIRLDVLDSDFIGSQVGQQLMEQGGLAMLTAVLMIMLYLSARFEWRFALGAIVALIHDVMIVLGVFAWTQLQFNLTVLASLLAIIGYSLNDSIIVADRIREFMQHKSLTQLPVMINAAIKETFTRTVITSGTTLLTIGCIWWLAGAPLQGFSVALFSGVLVGTLSSICISATVPELVGLDADYYKNKAAEKVEIDSTP